MRLLTPCLLAILAASPAPAQDTADPGPGTARAATHATRAAEAFRRCHRYLHGWLALADPDTGLIPRNTGRGRGEWRPADNAADNYAFMVLSAALTDRAAYRGPMLAILATEQEKTNRLGALPDVWSCTHRRFHHPDPDLHRLFFQASEYAKDGLLPITEYLGNTPWRARMLAILADLWARADVDTPAGPLPGTNLEVHGEMLQVLSRVYWMTGHDEHLDRAVRLGEHYLRGKGDLLERPGRLRLRDHGCEIVSGLCEAYATVSHARPDLAADWRTPLHRLLDRILATGRNEHGLFCDFVDLQSGERHGRATDSFGYTLDGYATVAHLDDVPAYRAAVSRALAALWPHYRDHPWEGESADGYADAIEGAINLLPVADVPSAERWIDSEIDRMWAKQRPDGTIEGWHGDGNFARTTLMYALWKTRGTVAAPWREDLRWGAARDGGRLTIFVQADETWEGTLRCDVPRHREHLNLPFDWPRINRFPEWFTVGPGRRYRVHGPGGTRVLDGATLAAGLPVTVPAGEARILTIEPLPREGGE